ncbi:MAG: hypothetical protein ACYS0H_02765 [Planctomycetota bacterium]
MNNNEESKNESEFAEKCCDTSCCGNAGDFKMAKDDRAEGGPGGCCSVMGKCRWFPLIPVVLGIVLLLLGYVLDPEVTRILWMTAAGLVILIGALAFLMMSLGKRTCC